MKQLQNDEEKKVLQKIGITWTVRPKSIDFLRQFGRQLNSSSSMSQGWHLGELRKLTQMWWTWAMQIDDFNRSNRFATSQPKGLYFLTVVIELQSLEKTYEWFSRFSWFSTSISRDISSSPGSKARTQVKVLQIHWPYGDPTAVEGATWPLPPRVSFLRCARGHRKEVGDINVAGKTCKLKGEVFVHLDLDSRTVNIYKIYGKQC